MMEHNILTGGDFDNEDDAWFHFDKAVKLGNFFTVHKEVEGEYLQPKPGAEKKDARIDRILIPTRITIDAGWSQGPIGVEGKKSGMKLGKLIAQALDYTRCAFELPHGFVIIPKWVFIFPVGNPKGDIESIMAQNRIGYIHHSTRNPLIFSSGTTHGMKISHDGGIEAKYLPMGNRTGSR